MANRRCKYLLAVVAIWADAAPVAAHVGDRLFPIPYLSEETLARLDLEDGSVEDCENPTVWLVEFYATSFDRTGLHGRVAPLNQVFAAKIPFPPGTEPSYWRHPCPAVNISHRTSGSRMVSDGDWTAGSPALLPRPSGLGPGEPLPVV